MKNDCCHKFQTFRKNRYLYLASISTILSVVVFSGIVVIHFSFPFLDKQIEKWLVSMVNTTVYDFFEYFTDLGDIKFIIPITFFLLVILFWKRKWEISTGMAITILGGGIFGLFLKILFSQRRIISFMNLPYELDLGFPSGHAMMAFLFYGYITYASVKSNKNPKWRWVFGMTGTSIVFLIGVSRLFIDVHLPTDVLGGWVMGTMWIILSLLITKYFKYKKTTEFKPNS